MTTKILKHDCTSMFQDNTYGLGNRVFNKAKDDNWRCTVCGGLIQIKPKDPDTNKK